MNSHNCVYKLSEKEGNILSKQKEKNQKSGLRETWTTSAFWLNSNPETSGSVLSPGAEEKQVILCSFLPCKRLFQCFSLISVSLLRIIQELCAVAWVWKLKGSVAFKGKGGMLRALWWRELNNLSEEKLLLPSGDYPSTSHERQASVLVKATVVSLDHLTNTTVFPVYEEGILQFSVWASETTSRMQFWNYSQPSMEMHPNFSKPHAGHIFSKNK